MVDSAVKQEEERGIPAGDESICHVYVNDNCPKDAKRYKRSISRYREDYQNGDRMGKNIHGITVTTTGA
jgi:hypothetical protein